MAEIESKQLELEQNISSLSLERLVELAKTLGIHEEGDGHLKLLRKVRRKLEEDVESAEDKLKVIDQMKGLIGANNDKQDNTEVQKAKEELERMQEEFNKAMELQKKQIAEATAKLSSLQGGKSTEPVCTPSNLNDDVRKALRRDFRIVGLIGGDNNKDRLSLVSLLRQIETGLKKNKYTESEVIEGVIRAISPSLKLRSYLEMIPDLTIAKLENILKAHYKQKSSTEIYQELTSACQSPKESAQDFLIRIMDLRQQVLFASDINDKTVKYDSGLVNGLFRHVIEIGLQSETIRTKMRPLLSKPDVSDEELMETLNIASSEECERENKLRSTAREHKATINEVKNPTPEPKQNKGKPSDADAYMTTLKALQAELASLRSDFNKTREGERNPGERRAPRRCAKCEDTTSRCSHCFKCGSSEHFARGCRKQQENSGRLRQRDME